MTTRDRAELCLRRHLTRMERRSGWIAPSGVLIAVVLTLTTARFTDALGLPAATWLAIFTMVAVGSAVWLVIAVIQAVRARVGLDEVLRELAEGPAVKQEPVAPAGHSVTLD